MLYLDIPTIHDIGALDLVRHEVCVSIYLRTTPVTQQIGESRINLGNLLKTATGQLEAAGIDKHRIGQLQQQVTELLDDDAFWTYQAHSLVILATPDLIRTYRLANRLTDMVEVSDRFHLQPLLRAVTFPHAAHVLALSENAVRLIEVSPDLPANLVKIADLPKDAASAVGKASINDRSASGRVQGAEGQKVRLAQYIRQIDAALRPILLHSGIPTVLAATQPLEALFRAISVIPVLPQTIAGSPDRLSEAELAAAARPVLDAHYAGQIAAFHERFERAAGASRATTDLSDAARAATFGGIETIAVNIDAVVNGLIDETTGAISFDAEGNASHYGLIDEIAGRALRSGAQVLAVRQADIPGGRELAAILRHPV
jgi:hypothetical protein